MLTLNYDKNNDEPIFASKKASSIIEELNRRTGASLLNTAKNDNFNQKSKINYTIKIENDLPNEPPQDVSSSNNQKTCTTTIASSTNSIDDRWIMIQRNTFTNWINEHLKLEYECIQDLKTDMSNGVLLIKLVNSLQKTEQNCIIKKYYKNPLNQLQCLENITFALNAITADGVRLVNIGNSDLYNGNLKLILGLIWRLILRYQIGQTKTPPKKLILAWINAILPDHNLNNLTIDLNDGLAIA
jgi:hypothetical protein